MLVKPFKSNVLCKRFKTKQGLKTAIKRYVKEQTLLLNDVQNVLDRGGNLYFGSNAQYVCNALRLDIKAAEKELNGL